MPLDPDITPPCNPSAHSLEEELTAVGVSCRQMRRSVTNAVPLIKSSNMLHLKRRSRCFISKVEHQDRPECSSLQLQQELLVVTADVADFVCGRARVTVGVARLAIAALLRNPGKQLG